MIENTDIASYRRELDSQLEREDVRPEEVDKRIALLRPLETAVADLASPPEDLNSAAGRIAQSLWHKSHPQDADLERLFSFLTDNSSMVRLTAAEAIASGLEAAHAGLATPVLPSQAKQLLQRLQMQEVSPVVSYELDRVLGQIEKMRRPRRQMRSKTLASPYVAGLPVHGEKFFGRRDVLDKIEKSLMQMGTKGVVLYGARRTGKTSVLHKIRDGALGPGFFCIYADMQAFAGTSQDHFVLGLLHIIDSEVRKQWPSLAKDLPLIHIETTDALRLRVYLHELLVRLKPNSLVLMLDEYEVVEHIIAASEITRQFQSLLEAEDNLYVILASARKVEVQKPHQLSTLLDTFKYLKLSFLDRDNAIDLIRGPAGQTLAFSDDAVDEILAMTAGHPFYIQLICQSVFDIATTADENIVAPKHVAKAIELFLQSPSPHLLLTWNGLTFDQEIAGVALANLQEQRDGFVTSDEISAWLTREQFPLALRPSEAEHSLVALRDIDWVEKQPQKNAYRITMELVRRWILENRSIRDLAEKHRENVLTKVPGYWHQTGAVLTDFVIFGLLFAFTVFSGVSLTTSRGLLVTVLGGELVAYFMIPILLRRSTLGMRLWQLRVVRASTRSLSNSRAALYGLLQGFRWLVQVSLLGATILLVTEPFTLFERKVSLIEIVGLLIPATLEVLDNLMMLFGKLRRGLYEKVTGTILIPAGIARE